MNCKKTAQLIPLFVEADLDTAQMQQVNEHLEKCISCHVMVHEFRASQTSLRAVVLPEFDEAMLARLRTVVSHEIARPTDVPHWLLNWSWKFAAATTVLILSCGIVMYRRPVQNQNSQAVAETQHNGTASSVITEKVVFPPHVAKQSLPETKILPPRTGRQNKAQGGVGLSERTPGNVTINNHSAGRATEIDDQILATAIAPSGANDQSANIPSFIPLPASQAENTTAITTPNSEKPTAEPEMLRIELQTADPNIRIIWFASKETIAANTKADLR